MSVAGVDRKWLTFCGQNDADDPQPTVVDLRSTKPTVASTTWYFRGGLPCDAALGPPSPFGELRLRCSKRIKSLEKAADHLVSLDRENLSCILEQGSLALGRAPDRVPGSKFF